MGYRHSSQGSVDSTVTLSTEIVVVGLLYVKLAVFSVDTGGATRGQVAVNSILEMMSHYNLLKVLLPLLSVIVVSVCHDHEGRQTRGSIYEVCRSVVSINGNPGLTTVYWSREQRTSRIAFVDNQTRARFNT